MHTSRMFRWTLGAALVAAAVFGVARNASADHRLWVFVDATSLTCFTDPNGNFIFGEAWGFDPFGTKFCETMSTGGTGMARCPGNVTQHQARIDTRFGSGSLAQTGTVYATSAMVTTWQSASSDASYTVPANSDCPSGGSFFVQSAGYDPPGSVP
jgi:hypothetical protein